MSREAQTIADEPAATTPPVTVTPFRLFVDAVSVIAIVNVVLFLLPLRPALHEVIVISEAVISLVFFADFAVRYHAAPHKGAYLGAGRGWLDLLTCFPLPGVRILRLFRVVRNVRAMRRYGVGDGLRGQVGGSVLFSVLFLTILTIQFGSLAVLAAETRAKDGNITSGSDAVWWAYVSITTVGYGDRVPVSAAGRIVGVVMLTVGVALFSTFTAYLAQLFFGEKDEEEGGGEEALVAEVRALRAELADLRAALDRRASDAAASPLADPDR